MMPSRIGTKGITLPLENQQNYWVLTLDVVILRLASIFDNPWGSETGLDQMRVEMLIDEARSNPEFEKWEALILSFEAKNFLSQNKFENAFSSFRLALDACSKRSYGVLRGEIARDTFSVALAIQQLIPGNHEKYHRNMIGIYMFYGFDPSVDESAASVSEHFWDTLYRPYPGVSPRTRS